MNKAGKNILKKGVLLKKSKKGRSSSRNEGKLTSFAQNKSGGLVRKETCFFKNEEISLKPLQDLVT